MANSLHPIYTPIQDVKSGLRGLLRLLSMLTLSVSCTLLFC